MLEGWNKHLSLKPKISKNFKILTSIIHVIINISMKFKNLIIKILLNHKFECLKYIFLYVVHVLL